MPAQVPGELAGAVAENVQDQEVESMWTVFICMLNIQC